MKNVNLLLLVLFFLLVTNMKTDAQTYPTVTIEEIQFVLNPAVNDVSFYLGDTVEVRALVRTDSRSLFVGPRWGCFVVDPTFPSEPWQGLFIIQNDSSVSSTLFNTVEPGMICRFTGVVAEFEGFTQLALLTDPVVPVIIESIGSILPAPIELGTTDLTNKANGEQWEGQFVRIAPAEIIDNMFAGNRAIIQDSTGFPTFIDDYFLFFLSRFNSGTYTWPEIGGDVDVTGFVRALLDGYSVNPRNFDDLIVISSAPVFGDVTRDPVVPTSMDDATITANISDNGSVISASLHYSIDFGAWTTSAMSANGSSWSADIPAQNDGTFVRYFVAATDNDGFQSVFPADTSFATGNILRYVTRNNGLMISDVQNTYGYQNDPSGYVNFTVTLDGVVMSGPQHFPGYYIQEAADAWSGIFARNLNTQYQIGDYIRVTGQIEEDFGLTKILVFSDTLITPNFGAFPPVPQLTGSLRTGGTLAEAYESVFVSFNNVTVTNAFPHLPNNFGEFIVDDGSGGMFVDDESELYNGNLGSEIENGAFGYIQGIHFYSFGEFKLAPRDSGDVDLIVGIADPVETPRQFSLAQNYPNPFNPSTTIRYQLAKMSDVKLVIYDLLGQEVTTLVNNNQPGGEHVATWNGLDNNRQLVTSGIYLYRLTVGQESLQRKMLFVK